MTETLFSYTAYQLGAMRTMKPEEDASRAMLHCVLGMVGEAGELHEAFMVGRGQIGEVGDAMWYAANLASLLGWDYGELLQEGKRFRSEETLRYHTVSVKAMLWAAKMSEQVKKAIFYNQDIDRDELRAGLKFYILALHDLAIQMRSTDLDAGEANLRKLAARYPKGAFDAKDAVNRDYEAETRAAGTHIE